jgi:2-iminobutanoate/2-iminopropanoate deaminase
MKPVRLIIAVLCLALVSNAIVAAQQAKKKSAKSQAKYLASAETKSQNLPFSDAVRVGNMLYLAGKIGTMPGTLDLAPGGIEPETKQAMENIGGVLTANGSSFSNVVKCTVMMADMKEWPDMNKVYVTFFPKDHLPARSAFGTTGLARNARVEIECMAVVK